MELIRGIHNIQSRHHGCVLTIGNFDGVHLGHQQVLSQVVQRAQQMGLPSVVMTFEPQPLELFAKQQAPARLTRLRDKFVQLSKLGLIACCALISTIILPNWMPTRLFVTCW